MPILRGFPPSNTINGWGFSNLQNGIRMVSSSGYTIDFFDHDEEQPKYKPMAITCDIIEEEDK